MKYTNEIFKRLSRGQFISSNSVDPDVRALYNDIEENQDEYTAYFSQIDFMLTAGDGFYYFSRKESKVVTENKLLRLFQWIDYLDFLKSFDTTLCSGTQFKLSQIEVRVSADLELREKLSRLYPDITSNRDKIRKLADEMAAMGFAEVVNEADEEYQVTSAFHYIEQIIMCINIDEEVKDEIPE